MALFGALLLIVLSSYFNAWECRQRKVERAETRGGIWRRREMPLARRGVLEACHCRTTRGGMRGAQLTMMARRGGADCLQVVSSWRREICAKEGC